MYVTINVKLLVIKSIDSILVHHLFMTDNTCPFCTETRGPTAPPLTPGAIVGM